MISAQGRLKYAKNLSFDQRHPILLCSTHPVVKFLLLQLHINNLHEGVEYVRNVIQQEFCVLGLRNALRKIKGSCVDCRKFRSAVKQPFMADLPPERLDFQAHSFTNTGIDYFGPFEVKMLRRTMKRWCCLFTCLTTRAVHIEVVRSLDADSCMAAIVRFISRRGKPKTIVSDNGSNFVGSARELREYIDSWNKSQMGEILASKGIIWKFNPPSAPHFGGVWERLVRSCKKAMFAILGSRSLTDETLITTMCLVEQTPNARPLTAVSDDPADLEALTPNHFLLGRSNVAVPFIPNAKLYANHKKMFKSSQAYADMIWKRWTNECLPQWNSRSKWYSKQEKNLSAGDLVWLVEDIMKRSHYQMARIIEVYPGRDGYVRSVLIKTATGQCKRPVVKLAPVFKEECFPMENRAGDVGAIPS